MKNDILILTVVFAFLFSCTGKKTDINTIEPSKVYNVNYAKGFSVAKYEDYVEVTVNNPWDSAQILQRYILVDKNAELPGKLPKGKIIRTPLENIVVYSTIHCTVLNELDNLEIIKGICEPGYVDIEYIQAGIKSGTIADLGQASSPDIEKIIMIDPEAIMATPIQGMTYGAIDKTGVPIVETPDYMESSPLARAEWIKFYAVFTGTEQIADSLFAQVEKKYNEVKELVGKTSERPTVFTDKKYGNVWYMPGGNSYMANLLRDAGAAYIWDDNESAGSVPLAFETVLDMAGEADYWLIKYNDTNTDMTYRSLEREFKPYSYFDAYRNRNIYGCNSGKVAYYEDLPVHPEYILTDMAFIFHPDLFPGYIPRYFYKIEE